MYERIYTVLNGSATTNWYDPVLTLIPCKYTHCLKFVMQLHVIAWQTF